MSKVKKLKPGPKAKISKEDMTSICLRLHVDDLNLITEASEEMGITRTDYIRQTMVMTSKKLLGVK